MPRLLLALFGGSLVAYVALMRAAPEVKVHPLAGLVLGASLFTSLSVVAAFSGGAVGASLSLRKRLLWLALGAVGCVATAMLKWELMADAFLIVAGTGLALFILPILRDKNIRSYAVGCALRSV